MLHSKRKLSKKSLTDSCRSLTALLVKHYRQSSGWGRDEVTDIYFGNCFVYIYLGTKYAILKILVDISLKKVTWALCSKSPCSVSHCYQGFNLQGVQTWTVLFHNAHETKLLGILTGFYMAKGWPFWYLCLLGYWSYLDGHMFMYIFEYYPLYIHLLVWFEEKCLLFIQ